MQAPDRIPGVLLTGTVGVGKTALAIELAELLGDRGRPAAVIDLDWLGWITGNDAPHDEIEAFIRQNLAAVWPKFRERGPRHLILTRMVYRRRHVDALRQTLNDVDLSIVRVVAPPDTVDERLRRRDTGSPLEEHLQETRKMTQLLNADAIEELQITNDDRPIDEVADELLYRLGWNLGSTL